MAVLLVTPPLIAPNAPYPATPLLTAFLKREGVEAHQADLSIALLRAIFTRETLGEFAEVARRNALHAKAPSFAVQHVLSRLPRYLETIGAVMDFLSGKVSTLPHPLPEGARFAPLRELLPANEKTPRSSLLTPHSSGLLHASLYLDDLADFIREGVDSDFGFARYAERLGTSATDFTPIEASLKKTTPVTALLDKLTLDVLRRHSPDVVGITVPFPGTLPCALRIAHVIKQNSPRIRIALGGGYVSTELRDLQDDRIYKYVDRLILDQGLAEFLEFATCPSLKSKTKNHKSPLPHNSLPAPDYTELMESSSSPSTFHLPPSTLYFNLQESPNAFSQLWSARFWNKLTLAHGCYWHRCAFCDTSLDYIARFDAATPETVLRWMDETYAQTKQTGFHFTDEAAPPALLLKLAELITKHQRPYQWWTNIRLDPFFTPSVCHCLAQGGCIAVTAGLECATERLLKLMDKGITLPEAEATCAAFASSGILVHVYLMYGFPTETEKETIEALEFVRKLFKAKTIHSAYWHRFALTCHSAICKNPKLFNIKPARRKGTFAHNDVAYTEPNAPDHARLGNALATATYNYRLGLGLSVAAKKWFE